MKNLSRRDLFRRAGKGVVGGTVLAAGLKAGDVSSASSKGSLTRMPITAAEKKNKLPISFCCTATGIGPTSVASAGEIMEWSLVNDCEAVDIE